MNPFKKWRKSQQCFGYYAEDSNGKPIKCVDPKAKKWCALGWLTKEGVQDVEVTLFCNFLEEKYKIDITRLNDDRQLAPIDFMREWDEFKK